MTKTRLIAVLGGLALAGCLGACPPNPGPGPQPGVTGGAPVATGGSGGLENPWTGGSSGAAGTSSKYAQCVKEQSADPVNQNVSKQSGRTLSSLVAEMCSDPAMQGGYR